MLGYPGSDRDRLTAADANTRLMPGRCWGWSPAQVRTGFVRANKLQPQRLDGDPQTYLFRTREGSLGVLQTLSPADAGVPVRFKRLPPRGERSAELEPFFPLPFAELRFHMENPLANMQPQTVTLTSDGLCVYQIQRPPYPTGEEMHAARQPHLLTVPQLETLLTALERTDRLQADAPDGRPRSHHSTFTIGLIEANGEAREIVVDRWPDEGFAYRPLLQFFRGVAHQEQLLYQLTHLRDGDEDAARTLRSEMDNSRRGSPPTFEIDYTRFLPLATHWLMRYRSAQDFEIDTGINLAGFTHARRLAPQLAELTYDHEFFDRAARSLGEMEAAEQIPALRDALPESRDAARALIGMGETAVPIIAELIRTASDAELGDRQDLAAKNVIRAYLEQWDQLHKPINPRIISAVRQFVASQDDSGVRIDYYQAFLDKCR